MRTIASVIFLLFCLSGNYAQVTLIKGAPNQIF